MGDRTWVHMNTIRAPPQITWVCRCQGSDVVLGQGGWWRRAEGRAHLCPWPECVFHHTSESNLCIGCCTLDSSSLNGSDSRRGSGSAVCEGGYWDDWQGGTQTLLFAESVTSYLPPSPLVWSVLPLSPKKSTPRAHNTPVQKPLPPTKSSWHMLTPPMQPTLIPWCCTDYYTQLCSPLLQCWAQSCLTHGL